MYSPGLKTNEEASTGLTNISGIQINPATEDKQDSQNETLILLRRMVKLMESQAVVDSGNRQKINIDNVIPGFTTTALGVALTGASSSAATTNYPTNLAPIQQPSTANWQPVWIGPVDQRYQIMDNARLVYDNGIRSHLSFT